MTIEVLADANGTPVGTPDGYTMLAAATLSVAARGFLANDVDLHGEAITAVSIQDTVDHGTLPAFADGSLSCVPTPCFSGTDGFAYRMRDPSGNFSGAIPVVISVIDPAPVCLADLAARAKAGKIQLTWTHSGAHHHTLYRGTISGGPYLRIGATSSRFSTCLDSTVVNRTTNFYVVRAADVLDRGHCQADEASATATRRCSVCRVGATAKCRPGEPQGSGRLGGRGGRDERP